MSQTPPNPFQIPPELRAMAEANVAQARKSFETFLSFAEKATSSLEGQAGAAGGVREISAKALAFAEKNIAASLDYAQRLAQAKELAEIMQLHGEYVQTQMRLLTEQAGEIGRAMTSAASRAAAEPMRK